MISSIISRIVILVFGTLYPAYASYKAVRTKNLKEYVKWMMYWIVFALFTCAETFTDVFLSWFPFYYEIKIILVLWLLSPATKGSSILYRKFVHPALSRREQEIDDAISKAKEQGYHTVLNLGTKGVNYATTVIMQTAIRGGGGLVQQLKKSYSLSDLTESVPQSRSDQEMVDEADDVLTDPRLIRRSVARSGYNTRRSASESNNRTPLYFSEVDVDVRTTRSSHPQDFSHIKSSEDISSGYSSAENSATREQSLSRTGSVGGSGRLRPRQVTTRSSITTIKRPGAAEGSEVIVEELHDNDNVDYDDLPPLLDLPPAYHISQTNPPFLFEYVGNQIRIVKILGEILPNNEDGETFDKQHSKVAEVDETINKQRDELEERSIFNVIPDLSSNDSVEIISNNDHKVNRNADKDETVSVNENIKNVPTLIVDEDLSNNTTEMSNKTFEECKKTNEGSNITEELTATSDEINQNYLEICISSDKSIDAILTVERKGSHSISSSNCSLNSAKTSPSIERDVAEITSMGTLSINDDAMETDDEASYGTPEDSPKAKKKIKRGKYGKSRAPAPPNIPNIQNEKPKLNVSSSYTAVNIENESPVLLKTDLAIDKNLIKEIAPSVSNSSKSLDAHDHITKKSHSPVVRKTSSSSIAKLMQLPGKFVFWHKTGERENENSSDDRSRRSSTVDKVDDFQSCLDLQDSMKVDSVENCAPNQNIPAVSDKVVNNAETGKYIPLTDVNDLEEATIAKDIFDKSDALQKLIVAKLESHPEYKTLHGEEIPSQSKSTEV